MSESSELTASPRATYRVQMHAAFGFEAAAGIADYLSALGVSHFYSSPYLQASAGSMHGYDVIDHSAANRELGGTDGHAAFCEALGQAGLGQVLDIVPNHMSISDRNNAWWWDVVENGPSSRYASHFDVDWDPHEAKLRNMVLLPILGDHYGRVLEAGELRIVREGGRFTVRYYDHQAPINPRSLGPLLSVAANRASSDMLGFIGESYSALPLATVTDRESLDRRHRDKEVLRDLLTAVCEEQPEVATAIDLVLAELNTDPDMLDAFLGQQNFRLAFWRSAAQDLGYRRFFDINTLVGLRTDDERVFRDTHALVLRWVKDGVIDGLRVDHPDGLSDPERYFRRLHEAAPRAWIVAEKILEPGEQLPQTWDVAGTSGYDFLNRVGGLFVDQSAEQPLSELYREFIGESIDYTTMVYDNKHLVMRQTLGSDVNRMTNLLADICERHRRYRDYARRELNHLLREVIACFPVYRTYVRGDDGQVSDDDKRYVTEAFEAAKQRRPELDDDLLKFVKNLMLLRDADEELEFVRRFQQLTGPIMAKGVEDTTFYCYNRFVSLNEVGGDPNHFGVSVEQFHRENQETQAHWPTTMLATSTHDTKRSEDVRVRIHLLSEIPDQWATTAFRWREQNAKYWEICEPDHNAEFLFYQTLIGAWPIEVERMHAYMEKATREAKQRTSWIDPNPEYDAALVEFISGVMGDPGFQKSLQAFVTPLILPGRINALAQTLLKLTSPGVPDIYQGTDLWDLSLVDPDNRRPVDYALRRNLLDELSSASAEQILAKMDVGMPKLHVIRTVLHARREHPEAFGPAGAYEPLSATGAKAEHVVAYVRGGAFAVVVPRLTLSLAGAWQDTAIRLPKGNWKHALTGEPFSAAKPISVQQLFAQYPVAFLSRSAD